MKTDTVKIPRWFDRHLHIRSDDMMRIVLPYTLKQLATGAIIMPNLPDPITTIEKAKAYRSHIEATLQSTFPQGTDFVPCMTLYLTDEIDPEEVVRGYKEGVWRAVKLYMANQQGLGGTTGSSHGVKNLRGRYSVFKEMEKHNIPLLGHFEAPEDCVDEFDREIVSIDRDLKPILKSFPGLPVVVEHITDGRTAEFVADSEHYHLYATVTAHHLMLNRNSMFWGGMNPGFYCKPVPKREAHRAKVRKYVTMGGRRFGAGTDSAPHSTFAKSAYCGCAAGIFTAPLAVELYTAVFDEDNALNRLGRFLSENFIGLYGMEVSREMMTIERKSWQVMETVTSQLVGTPTVPVFKGGSRLEWKLAV